MLLFAHRGWSARCAENSAEAFAAAAASPAQGCECDVRLSRDGRVLVCHDADLRRFGGSREPLAQRSGASAHADGLPYLEDVLDLLPRQQLFIEWKPHGGAAHTEALVRRTLAILAQRHAIERCAVLCFAAAPLALARRLAPDVRRVRNVERVPREPRWTAEQACWGIDADYRHLTAAAVRHLHDHGVQAWAYTVNQPAVARRCAQWGIDGIISDHADLTW